MPVAEPLARRRLRDGRLSPVVPAALLAAVLLADGAVVLRQSYAGAGALAQGAAPVALPAPAPAAAPVVPSTPVVPAAPVPVTGPLRLSVPALGIDAPALTLRTAPDGSLEVPSTAEGVGWYADGAVPGDAGPAVLAGHVDLDGAAGVFHRLASLEPGDPVTVQRPDGATVRFVVTAVEQHAKDAFPTDRVYGPTAEPTLRLITCGGSFDRRSGSYRDNVVVFARVSGTTPG